MYQHIIAAVDGSTEALDAALEAGRLAAGLGASLTLAHIVDLQQVARDAEPPMAMQLERQARQRGESALADARERLATTTGIDAQLYLGESWHGKRDMARLLAGFATATDADLLALGRHGRGGIAHRLMGGFVENLLREAPCPLLLIHRPGR